MAKITGLLNNISGTLGNHTFVQTKNGAYVREKTSISKKRFATDPRFQGMRENNAEFGRAGKAGKLLRNTIRPLLNFSTDSKSSVRLTAEILKIIKADDVHVRGQRQVLSSKIERLQGFDFNQNAKLASIFHTPYSESINRCTGRLEINVPPFIPVANITAPVGATHFKLKTATAAIDFNTETHEFSTAESNLLPLNYEPSANINLSNSLSKENSRPLFLVFGIQFFQVINGIPELIKSSTSNPLCLIKVSGS